MASTHTRVGHVAPQELAERACHVEIDLCQDPIGKQDQFAAAFGDLRMYRFHQDGSVSVEPLICSLATLERLQRSLLMFYTGMTRSASDILTEQTQALGSRQDAIARMHRMVQHAHALRREIENGNPDGVGEILHESWLLKRGLTGGISNPAIDGWYEAARAAGAAGGKILGAGGGGFLLLCVRPERQAEVKAALKELRRVPFRFEREGSKVIFYNPTTLDAESEERESEERQSAKCSGL